jgi:hypothetical protein
MSHSSSLALRSSKKIHDKTLLGFQKPFQILLQYGSFEERLTKKAKSRLVCQKLQPQKDLVVKLGFVQDATFITLDLEV